MQANLYLTCSTVSLLVESIKHLLMFLGFSLSKWYHLASIAP